MDGSDHRFSNHMSVVPSILVLVFFLFVFLHGVIFYAFQSFYSFYYSFS